MPPLLLLLLVLLSIISSTASKTDIFIRQTTDKKFEFQFEKFKRKYNKKYDSKKENEYRFGVFKSNLDRARLHQKLDPSATHGVTKFSDLTLSEFSRKLSTPGDLPVSILNAPILQIDDLPIDKDWRRSGAVTRVKDQVYCNASWAISVVELLESRLFITAKRLQDLSVQQLIDCDNNCSAETAKCDDGCMGGYTYTALDYILKTGGLMSDFEYPYTATDSNLCQFNKTKVIQSISKIYYIPHDEDQIAAYVAKKNPIVAMVNAEYLQSYRGGVYCPSECRPSGSHGVVLVGYDKDRNWIIKNSWGTNWGENGYFRLCKGYITCNDTVDPIALTVE